jgi:hypothetical protein
MNPFGIAAMGLAAWLLYSYFNGQPAAAPPPAGSSGSGTGSGAGSGTGAGSGSGTGAGSGSGTGSGTGTGSGSGTGTPTQQTLTLDQATKAAAAGDRQWAQSLTDRGEPLYTVDQWNYFAALGGRPPISPGDMPTLVKAGEEGMQITANEYLVRLDRLSVSAWHVT